MEFSKRQRIFSQARQWLLRLRNKKVTFGRNVYIGPSCVIDGIYGLEIGSNVYIGKRVTLEFEGRIGDGVVIANHVGIVGRRDHEQDFPSQNFFHARTVRTDRKLSSYTDIGDGCWIGYGAIILSGVSIGRRSIIGAGAVVTKDVEADSIVTSAKSVMRTRKLAVQRCALTERRRKTQDVIGFPIDVVDWQHAIQKLTDWAQQRESRVVCICNVHSLVTGHSVPELGEALRNADMTTSDGAPIAWMLRRLGHAEQPRINGPDLMWRYCAEAVASSPPVFLYGGSPHTLQLLKTRLASAFPLLHVAGSHSPPYRILTDQEDQEIVDLINKSGAGVVWVGLGCPKQEIWMREHRGKINAVMIGVGAAFDFYAGTVSRAPKYLQDAGLEWLYRLSQEPRRLWRRYLVTNTLFIASALRQLCVHFITRRRS